MVRLNGRDAPPTGARTSGLSEERVASLSEEGQSCVGLVLRGKGSEGRTKKSSLRMRVRATCFRSRRRPAAAAADDACAVLHLVSTAPPLIGWRHLEGGVSFFDSLLYPVFREELIVCRRRERTHGE